MYTLSDLIGSGIITRMNSLTEPSAFNYSEIPIRSISVQELPLDDFIQSDEIVLSTALNCDKHPDNFRIFIESAAASQASAILFSFRNPLTEVPGSVLHLAEQSGLPVFSIPWESRFSNIQSHVISEIEKDKLSFYNNIQNRLFNLYFDGRSLQDAIDLISESFESPVELLNSQHQTITTSDRSEGHAVGLISHSSTNFTNATVEISLKDTSFGWLQINSVDISLIHNHGQMEKYLAFPLSLWFNKEMIETQTKIRLKNDFVRNLATGNYNSINEMIQQGHMLNFDLTLPYSCVLMKLLSRDTLMPIEEYSSRYMHDTEQIEQIIINEARIHQVAVLPANFSMTFTIYIENCPPDPETSIQRFINSLEKKITAAYPEYVCRWGLSETSADRSQTSDFPHLHTNASVALRYCMASGESRYLVTHKDTKKFKIIAALSGSSELQEIMMEIIKPLVDYDRSSGIELLNTLREYLNSNYNISQTARNLHIHRQSLLYRLNRISELTGMSMNSHDDLFVLEAMLRLYTA